MNEQKNKQNNPMNTEYRYQLESRKLTGKAPQKTACPECGRRKCFVRYVDTRDGFRYVADHVGKCDHLHSCGYHLRPSEYFRDNPPAVPSVAIVSRPSAPPPLPPFQPLSPSYVLRSHSPASTFWRWFSTDLARRFGLAEERVRQVYEDYYVGATRYGCAIFWQIDRHGLVHGGHIMQYGSDGHRQGYQGWTHGPLIQRGLLPRDWQLYQCLFGEHLLPRRPDAQVCLVEGEKTALVMSALFPQHLWLATCGSGGLSPEKVVPLQGRRVTLFPDSGCRDKWLAHMRHTTAIDYNISDQLEGYPPNTDLCDLLLES